MKYVINLINSIYNFNSPFSSFSPPPLPFPISSLPFLSSSFFLFLQQDSLMDEDVCVKVIEKQALLGGLTHVNN